MGFIFSPFIVPLGAFAFAGIAAVAGIMGQAHARKLKADQRMAMLQRGLTPEQIELMLGGPTHGDPDELPLRTKDPFRSLANARRAAIVLVSVGLGLVVFGFVLSAIVQVREVLAVAASGIIPLAIGLGFFVDYHLQQRELTRFGLDVTENPK